MAKMHARFGKLPWQRVFQPAIAYAEQGFPVSEIIQELWADPGTLGKLRACAESSRVFLNSGTPPQLGEIFRNPDLEIGRAHV